MYKVTQLFLLSVHFGKCEASHQTIRQYNKVEQINRNMLRILYTVYTAELSANAPRRNMNLNIFVHNNSCTKYTDKYINVLVYRKLTIVPLGQSCVGKFKINDTTGDSMKKILKQTSATCFARFCKISRGL